MLVNSKDLSKESLEINSNLKLFQIYKNLKHVSLKCDTYFQTYEELHRDTSANSTLHNRYYSLQHFEQVRAHTTIFQGII